MGLITVNPPNAYEVSRELIARDIKIDYRENAGIRVAPHFYTTDDEVNQAMNAIDEILADDSWKQHKQGRDFVT